MCVSKASAAARYCDGPAGWSRFRIHAELEVGAVMESDKGRRRVIHKMRLRLQIITQAAHGAVIFSLQLLQLQW